MAQWIRFGLWCAFGVAAVPVVAVAAVVQCLTDEDPLDFGEQAHEPEGYQRFKRVDR